MLVVVILGFSCTASWDYSYIYTSYTMKLRVATSFALFLYKSTTQILMYVGLLFAGSLWALTHL